MAGLTDPIPRMAQIRPAVAADATGLAEVHVRTWQAAYRGIVPDAYLDSLSASDREASWAKILANGSNTVVADVDGAIRGFASSGPSHDDDARPETGEVYALYVDPDWQSRGTGQMLFSDSLEALAREGFSEATLWVLEKNAPSRGFYEATAMKCDGGRKALAIGGEELCEVRYRRRLAPVPGPRTSSPMGRLTVEEYDPRWPAEFEVERAAIAVVLPELVVEHVGSTSVPGLSAKPIIDIQAGAASFAAACDAVEPLSALAWEYAGEFGIPGRLYFRKHENGRRTHHLHLGVRNGRGWHQTIRFRDYLRAHPEAAAEYARIKRGLAAADREDVAAYPYRKSPFIRATLAKAAAEDQGASR